MKKGSWVFIFAIAIVIISASGALADTCNLNVKLINQDPYPAIPGDYVKLAFQVNGVENPSCGAVEFKIAPSYPFSLDPTENDSVTIQSGTYAPDSSSYLMVPFKVRVDKNAVEGSNQIKIMYATNALSGQANYVTEEFGVQVGNTKSDFDVLVQDVTPQGTSFIITNTGDNDANSVILTVESEDVSVSGPKSVVIGSLAKGDFTIAHVRVVPNSGLSNLNVRLSYSDSSGNSISLDKEVPIESSSRIEKMCWNSSEGWYVKWIFAVVGIFIGIEATILLRTLSKKRRNN